jgi:cell division protein FtsL
MKHIIRHTEKFSDAVFMIVMAVIVIVLAYAVILVQQSGLDLSQKISHSVSSVVQ